MQCVILAGGLATRLGALAGAVPKTLVPVAGRPFADWQLEWLTRCGVEEVVYCIGHMGDQIRAFVGDGGRWGLRARYVDEGRALRGTAGALRLAADAGVLDESFGVLYGDSYLQLDLPRVFAAFAQSRPAVLMTVYENDGRYDRSNVRLDGERVWYDKAIADPQAAGMRYIDYGFSVLTRDPLLELIPPGAKIDLAEPYRQLSEAGRVIGYPVSERFYEIGSPAGLTELEALLNSRAG